MMTILMSSIGLLVFCMVLTPLIAPILIQLGSLKWILIWLAIIITLVALHELMHGLFFWLYSKKVQFGVKWKSKFGPTPYATSPDSLFTKHQFQMIALAPQILSIMALILSVALFHTNSTISTFALMFAMTNLAGGCIDLYSVFQLMKYPDSVLLEDTGDGYRIWQGNPNFIPT
jgi:hypothetical protein